MRPTLARAACLDTLPHPDLFLRQQLVGPGAGQRFRGQLLDLACLVGGEVARIAAQHAAVELDDARRDGVEKGAVVGDDDDAAAKALEQLFEPGDGVEVEMVGRPRRAAGPRARRRALAPARRVSSCRPRARR